MLSPSECEGLFRTARMAFFGLLFGACLVGIAIGAFGKWMTLSKESPKPPPVVNKLYVERCQDCGATFTSDRPATEAIHDCPLCPLEVKGEPKSYATGYAKCPYCRREVRVVSVDEYGDYRKCECGEHFQYWNEGGDIKTGKVGG